MPKSARPWIVTPHDPIEKLDDNLWTVAGNLPGASIGRRMCIVKRSDGLLLFFHAIPLTESELAEVTAWGKPAALVLGHSQHGLDATPFAEKLGLKIYGPKANEKLLREHFDLAGTLEDLPADAAIRFESCPGTKMGEAVGIVQSGERVSLLFADVFQNNDPEKTRLLFRLLGFAGPKVVPIYRWMFMDDKDALREGLETLAALPNLSRIVPCHGEVIAMDPAGLLRKVASAL